MSKIIIKLFSIIILISFVLLPFVDLITNNTVSNNQIILDERQRFQKTLKINSKQIDMFEFSVENRLKFNRYYSVSFEEPLEPIEEKDIEYAVKEKTSLVSYSPEETTKPKKIEKESLTKHIEEITEKETIEELITEEISESQEEDNTEEEITENKIRETGYSAASTIWYYLRSCGYSKAVCAGILGNIMAECGGHTLDINPYIYAGNYYGICMWSLYYCPSINGASLQGQLNYLVSNIAYQINSFGYCYYSGFGYNAFLNLSTCEEAALAFAKCYERCGSGTYITRQQNARRAYNYFA